MAVPTVTRHLVSERFVKELAQLERGESATALRVAGVVSDLIKGRRPAQASRVQGSSLDLLSVRAGRSYRVVQWRPEPRVSVVASVRHRRDVYRWASAYEGDPPDKLLPVTDCPLVVNGQNDRPEPPAPVAAAPVPRRDPGQDVPVSGPQDLLEMAGRGLEEYLAVLSDEQQNLLSRTHRGLRVIRGPAGSGKTTLALYWARDAHQRITPGDRVLYLCYNRVLMEHAGQMLSYLYRGRPPNTLEYSTIDGWCHSYLVKRGVLGEDRRYHLDHDGTARDLEWAWSRIRGEDFRVLSTLPLSFWREEIEVVILGRQLKTRRAYLDQDRAGRRQAITAAQRTALWNFYRTWRWRSETRGRVGFEHLAGMVLDEMAHDQAPPSYGAVVLDEVQDLSLARIQVALAAAGGSQDRMAIFGDVAQRLYHRGFRWKDARLEVAGGIVRTLRTCHRSSRRVFGAADVMIRPLREQDQDEFDLPRDFAVDGEKPILISTEPQLVPVVVGIEIQKILDLGIRPSLVSVLAVHNRDLHNYARSLQESGIPAEYFRAGGSRRVDLRSPGVKLITIHSAKGMGFPWVVMVFPDRNEERDEESLRHLLFTGMTRAGQGLTVVCPEPLHHLAQELVASGTVTLEEPG